MARTKQANPSRCERCGRPTLARPVPAGVVVLVLAGGVLTFYLVGLPMLAAGVVLAIRRDPCVCEGAR